MRLNSRSFSSSRRKPVQRRRRSGDSGRHHDATGAQHSCRLGERRLTIVRVHEMVERAKHQHHRCRVARLGQGPRIGYSAGRDGVGGMFVPPTSYIHQTRHGIDQPNVVPLLGQPERVRAGSPTDIQHDRGCRRCVTQNELSTSKFLEAEHVELETRFFRRAIVIVPDGGIEARRRRLWHAGVQA